MCSASLLRHFRQLGERKRRRALPHLTSPAVAVVPAGAVSLPSEARLRRATDCVVRLPSVCAQSPRAWVHVHSTKLPATVPAPAAPAPSSHGEATTRQTASKDEVAASVLECPSLTPGALLCIISGGGGRREGGHRKATGTLQTTALPTARPNQRTASGVRCRKLPCEKSGAPLSSA